MRGRDVLYLAGALGLTLFLWLGGLGGEAKIYFYSSTQPFAGRLLTWWLLNLFDGFGLWSAATLIGLGSLAAYLWAVRDIGQRSGLMMTPAHLALSLVAPIPLMINGSHLYDLPTLALSAVGLAALNARNWPLLTIAFVLWSFNRETAFLLVIVYVLDRGRIDYGALALAAGYVFIRLIVSGLTAHLPSALIYFTLFEQLNQLRVQMSFAILYVFAAAGPLLLIAHRWQSKPALLRWTFVIWGSSLFGMYWLMGFPFELRVLHEVVPAAAVLALISMPAEIRAHRKAQDERSEVVRSFTMVTLEGEKT